MKINNKNNLFVKAASIVLLLFSCFFMYDFYKSLSGFIANGFREPLVMLPMILAYLLTVICFLFFIYDFYVNAIKPIPKAVYSIFVIIFALADLFLIFLNVELYASNNALGVYNSMPSIIVHFPYDMIIVLSGMVILQAFNLYLLISKNPRAANSVNSLKQCGALNIHPVEYIALSVLAIVVFIFTGASIYGVFSAFDNAFYDQRYIYLLLWIFIIPMGNLVLLAIKPHKANWTKKTKIITLISGIGANLLFGLLFLILELTKPNFIVYVGKPLFLITFSVSLPIEPCVIFGIMALGSIVMTIQLIRTATKKI